MQKRTNYKDYEITDEPFYIPTGSEVEDFERAFRCKRPVALIGPTGCGKTTLTEYMAFRLKQGLDKDTPFPYIEVLCNEDITETHLLGRYKHDGTWLPGPLFIAAETGGLVVLDEIVEARKDAIVLIHSLSDDRRILPVARKGEIITPPDQFMMVICYNPGYQIRTKRLKPSTAQRFVTIEMDYPKPELEERIITGKTGIDKDVAKKLVEFGQVIREAKNTDAIVLDEGASTRLLVMAAEFYQDAQKQKEEPDLEHIARVTILNPISNEETDKQALEQMLRIF